MSSLDPDDADARAKAGMSASAAHSGPTWQTYAIDYVQVYLTHHRALFCDDVWRSGLSVPKSPRAFGQVMKAAMKHGWMTKSDDARPSAQSNNSLRWIYTSKIYDPASTATFPIPPDDDTDPDDTDPERTTLF